MSKNQIIEFISKNKNNNIKYVDLYNNKFIKTLLLLIKNIMQTNKNILNKLNFYINKVTTNDELKELFYNNNFVSDDILNELKSNTINHIIIDNQEYYLSLYYYDIENINEYLNNIIIIIKIIKYINLHFNYKDTKFNVIIFLGNSKKYISDKIIKPINMNSGSSIPTVYANLWRKEEYEKVLIHELLHFIKADFYSNDAKFLENKIKKIISYETTNSINESYNETLAGIINMCYKSIKYNININKIYEIELNFLYIQTAKLIDIFGGNSIEDLFKKKITIKQTTSALSYIIFKMILFHNIINTIQFIENINIKCNVANKIKLFSDFLLDSINNKTYYDIINYYIKKIKDIHNTHYIKQNLRMSLI